MYWEANVKIFNSLNTGLQDSSCFIPNIILIAFFCKRKIFLASDELPQNSIPYLIIEWKYA
jgi:hypothetical protein